MTDASEALSVLGRTTGWLARNGNASRARYIEATLSPWADRGAAAGVEGPDSVGEGFRRIRETLVGFDEQPPDSRRERVGQMIVELEALATLLPAGGAAELSPRAVLWPEGVSADLPPKPLPLVLPPPVPERDESEAFEPARVDVRAEEPRVREERGGREERGREDRGREGREGREPRRTEERAREERPREERPREEGAREERPREERPREERPREERPRGERPREERGRGRDGRRQERGPREEREEAGREEPRRPEPAPVVEAPPPEPEIRTFPLAHPEGTGEPIEALDATLSRAARVLPAEIDALRAAGIATVADLLVHPPVAHDRAGERWIEGVTPEGPVIVRGTVKARCTRFCPGVRRYEVRVETDRGVVVCRWIGDVTSEEVRALRAGVEVGLAGRLEIEEEAIVLYEAEPLGVDGRGGDWFPRYDIPGVADTSVRTLVRAALRRHAETIQDHLPPDLIERFRLMAIGPALRDAHFPSNVSRRGRSRLGFDELLQVQLGVALMRTRERRDRGVANTAVHGLVAQAHGIMEWSFSDDQELAFDDIRRDLKRNQPMARLLQGDVGAGKHAIVQAAMVMVAEARHQALFLAPDALTAEHRYLFAEAYFRSVGMEPMLLVGAPNRAQAETIKKGDALILFATQAILRDPPAFRKLGLVVFEEHGPYGAADVGAFDAQGHRPDMLVFTPTPVPSAILLNLYGQLALSVIPPAPCRGVDTTAYDTSDREQAYVIAREAIASDQQVMMVFPMLRGQDLLSPSEARRLAEVLGSETFPGARIGIFNGGMSREERFRAYDDFQHRRSDVLLATTYVEHGPVVPNAAVLIVEHAHQYDLVRLHRLRSHVAHGWRRGKCLLVTSDESKSEARHNIDLLLKESDGFRIAELDLRHRGLEAVLGERAAEAPDFAWADPVQERDLFVKTRQEATRLLILDPGLKRRAHRALLMLVRARFGDETAVEAPAPPAGTPEAASAGKRRRRRRGK